MQRQEKLTVFCPTDDLRKHKDTQRHGRLTVFCGPMFAGKSTHLLAALKRAQYAKKNVLLYKPTIDNRYSEQSVVTHDQVSFKAHAVEKAWQMAMHALEHKPDVVGIDEAQFFDANLMSAIHTLQLKGTDVYVACLDRTSDNEPFGPVPDLLTYGDYVHKLKAVCVVCGDDAGSTLRTASDADTVMIGGSDKYEARCYACWNNPR